MDLTSPRGHLHVCTAKGHGCQLGAQLTRVARGGHFTVLGQRPVSFCAGVWQAELQQPW